MSSVLSRKAEISLRLHRKQGICLESPATEILYGGAVGGGKLLPLDTPIPTPFGFVAMGDIRLGSDVFDETGSVCQVTHLFDVEQQPDLYRLTFDDKSEIDCCTDHLWLTYNLGELAALTRRDNEWRARRRAKRPSRATGKRSALFTSTISKRNAAQPPAVEAAPTGTVRTTREIVATLRTNRGAINHAVRVAGCLDLPDASLPIDPYVLGVWLGDGTSSNAQVTGIDPAIWDEIERRGYAVNHHKNHKSHWISGFAAPLRNAGLLNNKHIPAAYLRGSRRQRLDILRGLMDTDGTVARNSGSAEFCNTNERIVDGVAELICSLGWKVTKRGGRSTLNGRDCGPKWTLKWMADDYVFTLPRKRDIQKLATRRTTRFRYITDARRIPSRPGRCISVNSSSHLYLASRAMIPTHNSFLMRAAAIIWCGMIPNLQVYLFRRIHDDLVKNHIEGPKGLRSLLQPWIQGGLVEMVGEEIRFWNGSKIYLCHCKDEQSRYKYLGAEIHVLLIDELTTFSETIYRFLRSRVRMVGVNVPSELQGRFPRIICGSNPGNIGHQWVKSAFIDPRAPLEVEQMPDEEGAMLRQYIPAKLEDNPSMATDDPGYAGKVSGLGSPELVRAMRDGDWNVVAGAFFPEFERDVHVIEPRSLPQYWMKFRSFDWGSARPFSVGWWTVSDGELAEFPRGSIIRYREWYGAQRDSAGRAVPNTGLRLTAEEVADGIIQRERGDIAPDSKRVMAGVADPSIFAEDGGPSIANRMGARKCFWRPADNTRVGRNGAMGGWDQVRARLKGDGEKPAMFIFSTCIDFIRTVPALQHDESRPEDVLTESEDHIGDEVRYACSSRPYIAPLPPEALLPEKDGYARKWKAGRQRGSSMAA